MTISWRLISEIVFFSSSITDIRPLPLQLSQLFSAGCLSHSSTADMNSIYVLYRQHWQTISENPVKSLSADEATHVLETEITHGFPEGIRDIIQGIGDIIQSGHFHLF